MSMDEAVLVLVLYRFARQRAQHGELLSMLAADKIAAMARLIGVNCGRTPTELGLQIGDILWTTEVLQRASAVVEQGNGQALLLRLDALLQDLRVSDVEGYEEVGGVDPLEPTAPEDTGVHAVTRIG